MMICRNWSQLASLPRYRSLSSFRSYPNISINGPHTFFQKARGLKRTIICHVGPTNSGKTFAALNALAKADRGIYCGPLRLLAYEVSEKLRSKGVKCDMITGNDKDLIENSSHVACTVEMTNIHNYYDVAVIDEAQLIGDNSRGWAWTQALLGLQCPEIHLCGSPSLLQIVKSICLVTNDDLEIKEYERLSPLTILSDHLGHYDNVKPGDCVIAFDRMSLYSIKKQIERSSSSRRMCSLIYGGLPPQARKDQAEKFNDPDGDQDILVASDAIGMGLNLSIKRIIFSTMTKFDGTETRTLTSAEVKQIAGRAGRFGSLHSDGQVTTLKYEDLPLLRQALKSRDEDICRAGIFPSVEMLKLISFVIDLSITQDIIQDFMDHMVAEQWGFEVDRGIQESTEHRVGQITSYSNQFHIDFGWIFRNFGRIDTFIFQLIDFMSASSKHRHLWLDYERRRNRRTKQLMLGSRSRDWYLHFGDVAELNDYRMVNNNLVYHLFGNSDKYVEFVAKKMAPKKTSRKNDLNDSQAMSEQVLGLSDPTNDNGERENTIGRSLLPTEPCTDSTMNEMRGTYWNEPVMSRNNDHGDNLEYDPILPLQSLLDIFARRAVLDQANLYFICRLDDILSLATLLDDIPLPFEIRYNFCCAPVSVDDEHFLEYFHFYAFLFSKGLEVPLGIEIMHDLKHKESVSPRKLLKIEDSLRIMETYRWLALRYPTQFVDLEKAEQYSMDCSRYISEALSSMNISNEFASLKQERKKQQKNKKQSKLKKTFL